MRLAASLPKTVGSLRNERGTCQSHSRRDLGHMNILYCRKVPRIAPGASAAFPPHSPSRLTLW